MTLRRQILTVLKDDPLDDIERAALVARGAAQQARRGRQLTSDEVTTVAFHEFALVIDADQAIAAPQESGPAAWNPDRPYGLYEEIQGDTR
ncbi:hypothetical protein AB5J56_01895 [Streptomyces sp. R21]|uniref:Uncharacterized protein n=1 Tax=Streptomyces sp. R21 TaxID=3238627 RepID=A0AB39NZ23_9ACTN